MKILSHPLHITCRLSTGMLAYLGVLSSEQMLQKIINGVLKVE
jgi:hypothetical protein